MYLPTKFENKNLEALEELIAKYPLATVISVVQAEPLISHLPLILKKQNEKFNLIGHLAKANFHWKAMQGESARVTAIFHGPQAYITPKWYAENDVPTWNYAVVQVKGKVRLLNAYDELVEALQILTDHMEKNSQDPWEFWLPSDLSSPETLQSAIVGFEIEIDQIQGKFKLSQNRSQADRQGVLQGLANRTDAMSAEVLKMMENLK